MRCGFFAYRCAAASARYSRGVEARETCDGAAAATAGTGCSAVCGCISTGASVRATGVAGGGDEQAASKAAAAGSARRQERTNCMVSPSTRGGQHARVLRIESDIAQLGHPSYLLTLTFAIGAGR